MRSALWFPLFAILSAGFATAAPGQFLYLSDQRIVTVETADDTSIVLNYINLGDSFEILLAFHVILIDEKGDVLRGHLFRLEDSSDPGKLFEVKKLIRPGQFEGYVITGKFDTSRVISRVLIMVGGRYLELEPVERKDFDIVASRVGQLDLSERDRTKAILDAGFFRGYGKMAFEGTPESADMERFFPEETVIPPVAMATPQPRLPGPDQQLRDPVYVRVQATVTRSGGLRDVQLIEGINERLDRIALETVQNSWVFLPAISGNELAEAELKLNVIFKR